MTQSDFVEPRVELEEPRGDVSARRVDKAPAEQMPSQAPHLIRAELRRRKAHLVRHSGHSLEQHLFNTFHILTAWRQPPRVRYAGLVHSVYSTDVFTHPTFGLNERDHVRALIGEAAERLTYLFCVIDRRELISTVRTAAHDKSDLFTLHNRLGGPPVRLSGADAGDLLAIYMANAAEQSCRPDRFPAAWLSHVSRLGRLAGPLAEVTPPVFNGCMAVVSNTDEKEQLSRYEQLVAHFGDLANSGDKSHRAGRKPYVDWPFVAEPLVWNGFHAIAQDRFDDAEKLGRVAAARLQQWGTAWDKRLSLRHWLQLCAALCDTTRADELAFIAKQTAAATEAMAPAPESIYIELHRVGLLPAERVATAGARATSVARNGRRPLPPRFQTYIAGLRSKHKKPRMNVYPGLRSTPWHDPRDFQLARDLEAAAEAIAAEAHALGGSGFQEEAENIDRTGKWSVLFLYERGRKNEDNCLQCPQTVAVIEANRTVLSLGGLAYFSRLEPGAHVAPHTGPTNVRLRCHLGIEVPDGCGLRVGGITRTWQEGRCVVFDDSFTHEVWNTSDRDRLVLIVDLWHPDLVDDEVILLDGLHRYATATGTGLVRYWNRNRAKAAAVRQRETSESRPDSSR